jgi:predicted methyltransferase
MRVICRIVLAGLALAVSPGLPQVAGTANEGYRTPAGRESVAKGLIAPDRDTTERPNDLVREIGVQPGMTVADIGTGPGYMLPFLSEAVGPQGRVLAEDIFDDFLASAKARAESLRLTNVQFIHGTERNPALPAHSVDLILALDSYHHYDYPRDMLNGFRDALKPGGKLAIVEYYKRPGAMGGSDRALTHIRLDDSGVIQEVQSSGFTLVKESEHIPKSQYVCIFAVRATGDAR